MTPEQIENFRKVLYTMFGSYALILPDSDIVKFRDMLQNEVNKLDINQQIDEE
jgi:cell division protein FtsL